MSKSGDSTKPLWRYDKGIRDHYEICPACGQAIDLRESGDVLHHEEPGHKPLPAQ